MGGWEWKVRQEACFCPCRVQWTPKAVSWFLGASPCLDSTLCLSEPGLLLPELENGRAEKMHQWEQREPASSTALVVGGPCFPGAFHSVPCHLSSHRQSDSWSISKQPAVSLCQEVIPKPRQNSENTWVITMVDPPFLQLRVVASVIFEGLHNSVPLAEGPKAAGNWRDLG